MLRTHPPLGTVCHGLPQVRGQGGLFVLDQHTAGLAAFEGTQDCAGAFQSIHDATCAVVAQLQFALDEAGGALLCLHHEACGLLEHAVAFAVVHFQLATVLGGHFGQDSALRGSRVVADELGDLVHFRRVHEGALDADQPTVLSSMSPRPISSGPAPPVSNGAAVALPATRKAMRAGSWP